MTTFSVSTSGEKGFDLSVFKHAECPVRMTGLGQCCINGSRGRLSNLPPASWAGGHGTQISDPNNRLINHGVARQDERPTKVTWTLVRFTY